MNDLARRVAQEMGIDPERIKVWTDKSGRLRVDLRMPEDTEYMGHDADGDLVPQLPDVFEKFSRVVEDLVDDPKDVIVGVGPVASVKV